MISLPEEFVGQVMRAAIILVGGLLIAYLLGTSLGKLTQRRANNHLALLVRKGVVYGGWVIVILLVLAEMGLDLTAVMATAGVATVAIGFAAQTSLSNLISGIFLVIEKPFQIGDIVRVGSTTGIILSIDLMSVKLRTFDNLFIRIPNETMIKSEVVNITRFPIRRMDINLRVSYRNDLTRVMEVLERTAARNPICMDEPKPLILVQKLGEHGVELLLGLWFEKTRFLDLRNSILKELKTAFDEEGIEIALPHLTVYPGKGEHYQILHADD